MPLGPAFSSLAVVVLLCFLTATFAATTARTPKSSEHQKTFGAMRSPKGVTLSRLGVSNLDELHKRADRRLQATQSSIERSKKEGPEATRRSRIVRAAKSGLKKAAPATATTTTSESNKKALDTSKLPRSFTAGRLSDVEANPVEGLLLGTRCSYDFIFFFLFLWY